MAACSCEPLNRGTLYDCRRIALFVYASVFSGLPVHGAFFPPPYDRPGARLRAPAVQAARGDGTVGRASGRCGFCR